jgi:hypothetical protein
MVGGLLRHWGLASCDIYLGTELSLLPSSSVPESNALLPCILFSLDKYYLRFVWIRAVCLPAKTGGPTNEN